MVKIIMSTRSMQSMFGASAASCTVSSYHVATVSRTVVNMVNKVSQNRFEHSEFTSCFSS